jgi:putative membrane protein
MLTPDPIQTAGQRLWGLLTRWILMAIAVGVATTLVPGTRCDDWQSLLAAAMILGILNALIKPILVAVALPLVLMTLGFMLLIINALLLMLTDRLVDGFHVDGFWSAMGASLLISLLSMMLGVNRTRIKRRPQQASGETYSEPVPTRSPPPGKGPIIDV